MGDCAGRVPRVRRRVFARDSARAGFPDRTGAGSCASQARLNESVRLCLNPRTANDLTVEKRRRTFRIGPPRIIYVRSGRRDGQVATAPSVPAAADSFTAPGDGDDWARDAGAGGGRIRRKGFRFGEPADGKAVRADAGSPG